ncbi:fibronectin type III domain-containing protein [Peptococcaceae bacterium 1198_IL3148]
MWKIIKYLLVAVMFVSIIAPINNAHLTKAEGAAGWEDVPGATNISLSSASNAFHYIYFLNGNIIEGVCWHDTDWEHWETLTTYEPDKYHYRIVAINERLAVWNMLDDNKVIAYIYPGNSYMVDEYLSFGSGRNSPTTYVTVQRALKNTEPNMSVTSPSNNPPFSAVTGHDKMTISGNVTDQDVGDVLNIYYRIDSGSKVLLVGNIEANGTKPFSKDVTVGNLSEGEHTLYTWVEDNKGGKSEEVSRTFRVDKTPPNNFTPATTADSATQITLSGSTSDPTNNEVKSGLHSTPYRFYSSATDSWTGWLNNTSRVFGSLTPNTQYNFKMEARDTVGNVKQTSTINCYTLALNPDDVVVTGTTNESISINIINNAANGNLPQHKIEVKLKGAGAGGAAVSSSDFNTGTSRTLTGLSPGTEYEVWVTTRNGDNKPNTAKIYIDSIFTNTPPELLISNAGEDLIRSEIEPFNNLSITGQVHDIDGDNLVISATIDGVLKTFNINEAPVNSPETDNWELTWDVLELNEGVYNNIEITAEDGEGNIVKQTYTSNIKIDKTPPPKPNINVSSSTWTNQNVTINITDIVDDGPAGVEKVMYSIDGGNNWIEKVKDTDFTDSTLSFEISQEGQYQILARTYDVVGHMSELSDVVEAYIDKTAPTISLSGIEDGITYYESKNPTYEISDEGSGLDNDATTVTVTLDGNVIPWINGTELTEAGTYNIKIEVFDYAGNKANVEYTFALAAPQIPVISNAEAVSNSSIIVQWSDVIGAKGYHVYRNSEVIETTTETEYIDTDLEVNTIYEYMIEAYNDIGTTKSVVEAVYTHANSPSNLQVTDVTNDSITVAWETNENPGGTEYRAEITDTESHNEVVDFTADMTSYTFGGLVAGNLYTIKVKARNGDSIETDEISITEYSGAAMPGTVTSSVYGSTEIEVSWEIGNNSSAAEFKASLYQGGEEVLTRDWNNETTWNITDLTPNTAYKAKVWARYAGAVSVPREGTEVVTFANKPTNLQITNITDDGLTLNWEANNNPEGTEYFIRCVETGQEYSWITATAAVFTGLTTDQTYTFEVKARNSVGVETEVVTLTGSIAAPELGNVDITPGDEIDSVKVILPELPEGAVRYEYKIQQVSFTPWPVYGSIFGGTVFDDTTSIPVAAGDYLGIAAVTEEGNLIAFKEIYITADMLPQIIALAVSPLNASIKTGETVQIDAYLRYNNGVNVKVTDQAVWSVTNETVATVTNGLVTGLAVGEVQVSATNAEWTDIATIEVKNPPSFGGGAPRPEEPEITEPEDLDDELDDLIDDEIIEEVIDEPIEDQKEVISDNQSSNSHDNNEPVVSIPQNPVPQPEVINKPIISGTVFGRVVDTEGNPLVNLRIELHSNPRITYTDLQGYYRFDGVELGKHTVTVKDDRYIAAKSEIVVKQGLNEVTFTNNTNSNATSLELSDNSYMQQVNFVLVPKESVVEATPILGNNGDSLIEKILNASPAVKASIATTAVGSSIVILLMPYRRRQNIIIERNGKKIVKLRQSPKRNIVINLTSYIQEPGDQITVKVKKSLVKKLKDSTIVLRYVSRDIASYKVDESVQSITANVDTDTFMVDWEKTS